MLHKEIPFLRIGLPLCIGIVSGLYFNPGIVFLVSVPIVIITGFIISLHYNKSQTNHLFGVTLSLTLFITGLILYSIEKNSISRLEQFQTTFDCTLSDYPEERDNSFRLTVKLQNLISENRKVKIAGSMVLYYRKDSTVSAFLPGDQLIIRCTPLEFVNRGNPSEFDYRFYMENQGIRYYAFAGSQNIIKRNIPDHRKLAHRALIIREKIISMYRERGITGERLALVAAMTLGQRNMLDPEQKQNFIKAGVMHIMAVSGLHAVILSLFVFSLLFFLKRRFNILRIIITIFILWAFAFVTGLTPSVLRATLMFSFIQAGNLMKRKVNAINSVLASAFVLILIKPSVIFDAGFLLSYSAVIYIISFYQDFYLKLQCKNWLSDKIWQSAVITIVAQAGTLPLTIMLFNRFPTYFIITNILIVPLSNLLIIIGCLVPLLYPVKLLSHFMALFLNYLTGLTELLTAKAAALPLSTIENIGMTNIECMLMTLVIFMLTFYLLKRKSVSVIYPIITIMLLVSAGTIKEINTRTTNELIVYNIAGTTTYAIRTGKVLNLYSDTSLISSDVKRNCATLRLRIKANELNPNLTCSRVGSKKILACNYLNNNILQKYKPDIIILTGFRPKIEKNLSIGNIHTILIITSGTSAIFQKPQPVILNNLDSVHYIRKSGAYIKSI